MSQSLSSHSESSTSISLIKRARLQDQRAWERLTTLYTPIVYGWLRSAHLSEEDAADVVQEVFRSVAGSIETFGRDGKTDQIPRLVMGHHEEPFDRPFPAAAIAATSGRR